MVIYGTFTNIYNLNKRDCNSSSGHILRDILSVFMFSLFIDMRIVYNETWMGQKIISKKSFKHHTYTTPFATPRRYEKKYDKIKVEDKTTMLKKHLEDIDEDIWIDFKNISIFPPKEVFEIDEKVFNEQAKPLLRSLYFFDHKLIKDQRAVIHIRQGDLVNDPEYSNFNIDYYQNIVDSLNELNLNVVIICERDNHKMKHIRNCNLITGSEENIDRDFNYLANAKILILSCSSFSLFAGYINDGIVMYDKRFDNMRYGLFKGFSKIPNVIQYNNHNDMKDKLKEKLV